MTELHLVCGDKNYSSWSMRAWLVLRHAQTPFTSSTIELDTDTAEAEKLAHSPTGRVPVLEADGFAIWDSLAICEYLAETFPDRDLWPNDATARARARSLAAEMHAGFAELRDRMPLNCRARKPRRVRRPGVRRDIDRILAMWRDTREQFGPGASSCSARSASPTRSTPRSPPDS